MKVNFIQNNYLQNRKASKVNFGCSICEETKTFLATYGKGYDKDAVGAVLKIINPEDPIEPLLHPTMVERGVTQTILHNLRAKGILDGFKVMRQMGLEQPIPFENIVGAMKIHKHVTDGGIGAHIRYFFDE